MHDNPALAAEFAMPDDGSGEKKVYKIVDSGNICKKHFSD